MKEFTLNLDKETKRTYRYTLSKNNKGISGSLYYAKESFKGDHPPKEMKIKI